MDPKQIVTLEAFREAYPSESEASKSAEATDSDIDSDDDGDWLFADDRKRKAKEPKDKIVKKRRPHKADLITDWITSAKIDKLCEILEAVRQNDPTEKVIVFSQFTGFLDLLHHALTSRNFKFGRVRHLRWRGADDSTMDR
jgi:SNF2 family DNA or RNA helicase